jgi:hypothetical protein
VPDVGWLVILTDAWSSAPVTAASLAATSIVTDWVRRTLAASSLASGMSVPVIVWKPKLIGVRSKSTSSSPSWFLPPTPPIAESSNSHPAR